MSRRTLVGVFKANLPHFLWMGFPIYIGSIIFALGGRAPTSDEWGAIIIFLVLVTTLVGIAQFSNTYADRGEDNTFVPSNPLLTGELDVGTAKKAFILQNIIGGLLLIALWIITREYWLITALVIGWVVALTYSLPPFRFKERIVGPFVFGLGQALKPIVAWLVIEPSLNSFIIAFAVFLFVSGIAFQISMTKLRKTFDALNLGLIKIEGGSSVYEIRTSGLKLPVRTALSLEALVGLGSFILIPVFWNRGMLDMTLSIALLTLPLAFMILTVISRMKEPVKNTRKCEQFSGMAFSFIGLAFFAVAVSDIIHWALAVLASIIFLIGFRLLIKIVHPFGVAYRPL